MGSRITSCIGIACLIITSFAHSRLAGEDESGFVSLFDGKTLTGWKGNEALWRVEDGAITGETKGDAPIDKNRFLIWADGELDDFDLRLRFKIESGNSGIQIRSFQLGEPDTVGGYQADIDAGNAWTGTLYGEAFRGILAKRGETATIGEDGKPSQVQSLGNSEELAGVIKKQEWNDYRIVARGYEIEQYINGTLMAKISDEDLDTRRRAGLLAFQLHKGPAMKVAFRDIRLKRLPLQDRRKIVFVAGQASHAARNHEHYAGSRLLADALNQHGKDQFFATVYRNGWPADRSAFENANAVVIFADGGKGHPAYMRMRDLNTFRERGIGLGAIHYAVEMTPGETNNNLIASIGGAFEIHHSVNPHWTASFKQFPKHPVANGLKPFSIHDEWYFNMRFAAPDQGTLTHVLSAVPPMETMNRSDGPHSGNPTVRTMVEQGLPQHVGWVYEGTTGSRGFGFTGAHNHDNWTEESFRKFVLNAIAWISGAEVPENGIETPTPTAEELDRHLDAKPAKK